MAQALVLGATGHIGAHIVRALLAAGHRVRATYRSERFLHVLDGLDVERVRVDLDEPHALRRVADGCEWVFHAAGYYPSFRARRNSAIAQGMESTRAILNQLRAMRPARIVYTSSAATIRQLSDRPAHEEDAESWPLAQWRPLYATVKVAMEHEVRRAIQEGVPIVTVNPSFCIGEYDAHPFSGQALLLFAKGRFPWFIEHRFNAIYTGDVGMGHLRAAERGRVGGRYLLTHADFTVKEFATRVALSAGVRPPRWRIPYRFALATALATEGLAWLTHSEPLLPRSVVQATRIGQRLDGSKAVKELGLSQISIEEAIHLALAWFREHGYLKRQ